LLLDLGADINQRRTNGKVALHQAAWEGKQELIRFLLARGADPDIRDGGHTATPASWANHSGKIEARDQLLDHTRDVFDLATWGRVDALAEVLAADPAQARRRRSEGETPLHRLETGGERGARVIDLLSDHGADILARNKDGYTPLDCAPNQGEGIRELLIERGADGGEHPPPSAQTAD
jgi:ankyrin repeat protein